MGCVSLSPAAAGERVGGEDSNPLSRLWERVG